MHVSRFRRRAAAAVMGVGVSLLPVVVFAQNQNDLPPVAAISAPSPQEVREAESIPYRRALHALSAIGMDEQSAALLWTRVGPQLADQLEAGALDQLTLELLALPYCRTENLERYRAHFFAHPELSVADAATQVNIGLDRAFFDGVQDAADPTDTQVLVNKYTSLPADYVPQLTGLSAPYGGGSLTPEAAGAFVQMADAARADGISLRNVSAYRSYRTQAVVYQRNVDQATQRWADTYSARPGYSEHQTGLALDINVARTHAHFEDTAEYAWLQAHCVQYGFILRYPQGKDAVTGFRFEPWHYRYVGVETAQACTALGLTYDEYAARLPVPGAYPLPNGV